MGKRLLSLVVILFIILFITCSENNFLESEDQFNWEDNSGFNSEYENKIVFASTRGINTMYNPTLHIMNEDGSDIIALTPDQYAFNAAWSPNKWKILFLGYQDYNSNHYSLFSIDYDGKNIKRISAETQHVDGRAAWSPDGKKIAFLERDTSYEYSRARIVVANPDGSNPKIITGWEINIGHLSWDRSNRIFFEAQVDGKNLIYHVDGTGGNPELLFKWGMFCSSPTVSPNGRKLAFQSFGYIKNQSTSKIFIYDFLTKEIEQLNDYLTLESSPSWSYDGKYIVFQYAKVPENSSYRMDNIAKCYLETGEIVVLTDSLHIDYNPCAYK